MLKNASREQVEVRLAFFGQNDHVFFAVELLAVILESVDVDSFFKTFIRLVIVAERSKQHQHSPLR